MAETPSYTPLLVIIVVVIVAAAGAGVFLYFHNLPKSPQPLDVVQVGDNVTVNYVGVFGSGLQTDRVFDTSLYATATNNAAYPKSLEYHSRGAPTNYTPLAVNVGPSTPSGGYSLGGLSFITVVTGFWQGLLGLPANQSRSITVPEALGYGPTNPACLLTRPLTYTIPVYSTLTPSQFAAAYPGITATTSFQFPDPHYHWTDLIVSANASSVTLENLPVVGSTTTPAGWPVLVSSIGPAPNGASEITLVNEIFTDQAGLLLGHDFLGTGPCSSQSNGLFIVSAVNTTTASFTENFNPEVVGQTLIFQVTVVGIFAPVAPAV